MQTHSANQVSMVSNQNIRQQKIQEQENLRRMIQEQRHMQFLQIKRQQELNEKRLREAKQDAIRKKNEKRNNVIKMEKIAEARIKQFYDLKQEACAMEKWKMYQEEEKRILEIEKEIQDLSFQEDQALEVINDKQFQAKEALETLEDAKSLPVEDLAPKFRNLKQNRHTKSLLSTSFKTITTPTHTFSYMKGNQNSKNFFRSPQGKLQHNKTDDLIRVGTETITPDPVSTRNAESTQHKKAFSFKGSLKEKATYIEDQQGDLANIKTDPASSGQRESAFQKKASISEQKPEVNVKEENSALEPKHTLSNEQGFAEREEKNIIDGSPKKQESDRRNEGMQAMGNEQKFSDREVRNDSNRGANQEDREPTERKPDGSPKKQEPETKQDRNEVDEEYEPEMIEDS